MFWGTCSACYQVFSKVTLSLTVTSRNSLAQYKQKSWVSHRTNLTRKLHAEYFQQSFAREMLPCARYITYISEKTIHYSVIFLEICSVPHFYTVHGIIISFDIYVWWKIIRVIFEEAISLFFQHFRHKIEKCLNYRSYLLL